MLPFMSLQHVKKTQKKQNKKVKINIGKTKLGLKTAANSNVTRLLAELEQFK